MADQLNNKRIASNAFFLYFRMILLMLVSLYTSRVILQSLGAEDYGIYNVVGGIVVMFVFVNYAMTNATQRYITFELGKKDEDRLNKVFCTSLNIHILIASAIFILVETVGCWFLYNKLVIPEERLNAAFWALQFSALSTVVNIISVPYNAMIIAYERMSAFAYISIFDAVCKLLIAFLIGITQFDRLIVYAFMLFLISVFDRLIYNIYCNRRFSASHYKYQFDISLTKEMTAFALWSIAGNLAHVAATQGLNMLLNMFFSPIVNAARAVAVQVQTALVHFATNVENAFKPQITKSYAQGEFERLQNLTIASARFSFYTLLLLALPIVIEVNFVLQLWLHDVPEHTNNFFVLIIIISLLDTLSGPLLTIVQATGKIRRYQLTIGGIYICLLPLSYLGLKFYTIPEVVFIINIIVVMILQFAKIQIVCPCINMSRWRYVRFTYLKALFVVVLAAGCTYLPHYFMTEGFWRLIIVGMISTTSIIAFTYFIGTSSYEKAFINGKCIFILKKIKNRFIK